MKKSLTWSRFSKVLKNSYVKLAILSVIFLGGVFAFWFGVRAALRTEYPLLVVASQSMLPTLDVSDIIIVQGTNPLDIKATPDLEGDIIVFYKPTDWDTRIVHRAIKKEVDGDTVYFQTRGDNNLGADNWGKGPWTNDEGMISDKLLLGKVVGVIPIIGNVPLFIRTPLGMFVIVILYILVLLVEFIPELWGKKK